jgi:hypothetical protein
MSDSKIWTWVPQNLEPRMAVWLIAKLLLALTTTMILDTVWWLWEPSDPLTVLVEVQQKFMRPGEDGSGSQQSVASQWGHEPIVRSCCKTMRSECIANWADVECALFIYRVCRTVIVVWLWLQVISIQETQYSTRSLCLASDMLQLGLDWIELLYCIELCIIGLELCGE